MKIVDHPHGFYVDSNGVIQNTANPREGTYCKFLQGSYFVAVLECSVEDHEVLGEYDWHASVEDIQKLSKG